MKGKVYGQKESALRIRLVGQAPIAATVYELERLRCNLCGKIFEAEAPEERGEKKYNESRGDEDPGRRSAADKKPGSRKRLHYFLFSPPHHSGCCIQRRFFDIAVSRSPGALRRACVRDFGCGCDRHTPRTEHVQQIKPVSCCGGTASELAISGVGAWVYTAPSEIIR